MPFSTELSIAVAAVRRAAEVCRNVQRAIPAAMEKQDKSPVTIADFASQAVICRALGEAFPNDPIIGEEDSAELRQPENKSSLDGVQLELNRIGLNGSPEEICRWIDRGGANSFGPRFWTLDPIDGTKGFLRGEQYAVSLALIVNGRIEVAILGCPNLPLEPGGAADAGTIFFAVRDQGASVQSCFGDSPAAPVRVTSTSSWADVRLCESVESGHSAHDRSAMISASLGIVKQPVRLDSQAKYAVVARGEVEIGFQQVSELLPVPGIAFLGPLPDDIQQITIFSAGMQVSAGHPDAAKALLDYITAPAAAPAIRKAGMEPA